MTDCFKSSIGNSFLTCDFSRNFFREFDHFGFEFLCCRVFALVVVFEELNIQNLIFNIRIIGRNCYFVILNENSIFRMQFVIYFLLRNIMSIFIHSKSSFDNELHSPIQEITKFIYSYLSHQAHDGLSDHVVDSVTGVSVSIVEDSTLDSCSSDVSESEAWIRDERVVLVGEQRRIQLIHVVHFVHGSQFVLLGSLRFGFVVWSLAFDLRRTFFAVMMRCRILKAKH